MQQWNAILVILAVVVLLSYPIWGRFLKMAINRRLERAGSNLATRARAEHAEVYARTLVVEADPATVNALADAVAVKQRAANPLPGVWYVRGWDKNEPMVVESSADGAATVLRVTRAVVYDGGPVLSQVWTKFFEAVKSRADELGLVTRVTGLP
jgi:hypothetical protein